MDRKRPLRFAHYLLVTTLPLLLLTASATLLLTNTAKLARVTELELVGVDYAHRLQKTMLTLQRIQGLVALHSAESALAQQRLVALSAQLRGEITAVLDDPAGHRLGLQQTAQRFYSQLEDDLRRMQTQTAEAIAQRLTDHSNTLRDLILQSAEHSHLILDPELDTYYLMDMTIHRIPSLVETLGRLRSRGSRMLAENTLDAGTEGDMRRLIAAVWVELEHMNRNLRVTFKGNPDLRGALEGPGAEVVFAVEELLTSVETIIVPDRPTPLPSAVSYYDRVSSTIEMCCTLCDHARVELKALLRSRHEHQRRDMIVGATSIGIAIALVALLFISLYRRESRMLAQIGELAVTDSLTGAANRARFNHDIELAMEQARRHSRPLAVLALDIDHFKQINDTYGHHVGDTALKALVETVEHTIRRTDTLYRSGGEEFHLLLPETTLEGAQEQAERVRRAVAECDFKPAGPLSVSIGVATYHPEETNDDLLRRADEALYRAKEGGRNRVCIAAGET